MVGLRSTEWTERTLDKQPHVVGNLDSDFDINLDSDFAIRNYAVIIILRANICTNPYLHLRSVFRRGFSGSTYELFKGLWPVDPKILQESARQISHTRSGNEGSCFPEHSPVTLLTVCCYIMCSENFCTVFPHMLHSSVNNTAIHRAWYIAWHKEVTI